MNRLMIRNYVPDDLAAVVSICNKALKNLSSSWPNPMTLEWFMNRFAPALEARCGTAFIAERDGRLVGCVLVTALDRPEVGLVALIRGICVIPSFQRRGIGSKLIEKAIDWGKKKGAVLIENDDEIIENPIAVSFFQKLGFEIFHRGACMCKDLTSIKNFVIRKKYGVRELKVGDLDQLLRVRREAFREFGPWYSKPDGEAFKRGMRNRIGRDDVKVFVAAPRKQVIGYVVCSTLETDKTAGDIRVICVLPEYRNKGVGTALLSHASNFARTSGFQTLSTVTETAEGFYQKVGFKTCERFVRVRRRIASS